jgi:hypothetical protein
LIHIIVTTSTSIISIISGIISGSISGSSISGSIISGSISGMETRFSHFLEKTLKTTEHNIDDFTVPNINLLICLSNIHFFPDFCADCVTVEELVGYT